MNIVDDGQRIEFVCSECLHSVMASDTGPWPRCPRGHGRLTPDDLDLPRPKTHAAGECSPAAPHGRRAVTPASTARRSLAGL